MSVNGFYLYQLKPCQHFSSLKIRYLQMNAIWYLPYKVKLLRNGINLPGGIKKRAYIRRLSLRFKYKMIISSG